MKPSARLVVILLASTQALASACHIHDHYSDVIDVCGYYPADPIYGSLTPECRKRLMEVIEYNEDSWEDAPPGLQDAVTAAFQALIGYPLAKPPGNKVFSLAPADAGAFPLDFYRIFEEWPDLNQSIFNYVLNQFDTIKYEPPNELNEHFGAEATIAFSYNLRQMTIFDGFYEGPDPVFSYNNFIRAGSLVHEARHGDGITHEPCDERAEKYDGVFECDADFLGPHGLETAYLGFLLHGSGVSRFGEPRLLTESQIRSIGRAMCRNIKMFILNPFDEVAELLKDVDCDEIDAEWVIQHEGLLQ